MNDADGTLFSAVQGWIKNTLGSDFGGRFLAQVIKEVARVDPRPLQQFFAQYDTRLRSRHFRLEAEQTFSLRGRSRRADLVAYVDDTVVLLVELKYRDRLASSGPGESSQLADYLYLCRHLESGPRFLLMHRDVQEPEDVDAIESAKQSLAHYGEMVRFLEPSANPVTRMLLDYLREEGMVIDPIDTELLFKFLHRLVLPLGGSGRINVTSQVQEGPLQFQRLLGNLRLLSSDITPHLRAFARQSRIRSATIDFEVVNEFDAARVRRLLSKTAERIIDLGATYRNGGMVDVFAQTALINYGAWLYVNYGLEFHLRAGRALEIHAYAVFLSPDIQRASGRNAWDERFIDWGLVRKSALRNWRKGDFEKIFLQYIKQAARLTLRSGVISDRQSVGILGRLAK